MKQTVSFIEVINNKMLKSMEVSFVPRIGEEVCFYPDNVYKVMSIGHHVYDNFIDIKVFLKPISDSYCHRIRKDFMKKMEYYSKGK